MAAEPLDPGTAPKGRRAEAIFSHRTNGKANWLRRVKGGTCAERLVAASWKVVRAEEHIVEREKVREILAERFWMVGVVPPMEPRRCQEVLEGSMTEVHVNMHIAVVEGEEHCAGRADDRRDAETGEQDHVGDAHEDGFEKVEPKLVRKFTWVSE